MNETDKSVLLVGRDKVVTDCAQAPVEGSGFHLVMLESPPKALSAPEASQCFALVYVEQPGEMDGAEFISQFRTHNKHAKVVLIAGSWIDSTAYANMQKDLKIDCVMHLPVRKTLLQTQLKMILGSHAPGQTFSGPDSKVEARKQISTALKREFGSILAQRILTLQANLRYIMAEPGDTATARKMRKKLHIAVHNLRGTSGSLGFSEVATYLQLVDSMLAAGVDKKACDAIQSHLSRALDAAKPFATTLTAEVVEDVDRALRQAEALRVLVVADNELVPYTSFDHGGLSFELINFTDTDEAFGDHGRPMFDAALIDVQEEPEAAYRAARELRAQPGCEALPIAFVFGGPDSDPVDSAHSGASMFLRKPLETTEFQEAVHRLTSMQKGRRSRVLVVDDDQDFARIICAILGHEGLLVRVLHDPEMVIDKMDQFSPDIVLLDVMMPGVNGFEVCRRIRTFPQWQDVPVIFLTAQVDVDSRISAFEAGADDYLAKPIVPKEVVARVKTRLERAQLFKERLENDLLTGLTLRKHFTSQLNMLIEEASKHNFSFSLGLLDLDDFKTINDTYGYQAGDEVLAKFGRLLRSRFRVEDLRCRWGGAEFVIVFKHGTPGFVQGALTRMLDEFKNMPLADDDGRRFSATFSGGVATFPRDGTTAQQLMNVAYDKLGVAKSVGRNTIIARTIAAG